MEEQKLYRVFGTIPGVGEIDRKTQAWSVKQALRFTAEWVREEFYRKRGLPVPQRLFLGDLTVEEIPTRPRPA